MSLDLNVYTKQIDDTIIPKWIDRINQYDMECEIHPDFSFTDHNGFLPFKIKLIDPKNQSLKGKEFISGFEFYKEKFDLQKEIEALQPKRSFLQKILNIAPKIIEYSSVTTDSKLADCKLVMKFKWGGDDSLQLRMASLSSAIMAELINGVCYYPADNIWYDNKTIVEDAFKDLTDYENSLKPNEWKVHEFQGWEN